MSFKLIFFDCDGVLLIGSQLWLRLHQAVGLPEGLDSRWLQEYFSGKISFRQWIKNIENFYLEKKLTRSLFEKTLSQLDVNPEAYPLLRYLKKRGIKTAIISSGIDYYVKPVAQKLKIDFWRTNYTFIFNKDDDFKRINYLDTDEKAKVIQIKEICQTLKIKPTQTIFVGDSWNDLEAFKITGHGVLYKSEINGYKEVAWKTIKNLEELKTLLRD